MSEESTILKISEEIRSHSESHSETEVVVIEAVSDLLSALGKGDITLTNTALEKLGIRRDNDLYHRVGHLARNLHDSLTEFKTSLEKTNFTMSSTNLPDAADKLERVMKMTEEAAERTMNLVDSQSLKIKEDVDHATKILEALESQKTVSQESYNECLAFFKGHEARMKDLDRLNSEIIVAQTYQDLTGQALQKVVKLVTGIEKQLISLIQLFSGDDSSAKNEPQEAGKNTATVGDEVTPENRLSQDETDDLLARFGF